MPLIEFSKNRIENINKLINSARHNIDNLNTEISVETPNLEKKIVQLKKSESMIQDIINPSQKKLTENLKALDKFSHEEHIIPIRKNSNLSEDIKKVI